ncbi:MAG: Smr/MutS family protein [Pyrinomonadaceae bacterium]|nr:Smr/MutS family protein [Pyrinomonadaceae bacterium]
MSFLDHIKKLFAGQKDSDPEETDLEWAEDDGIDPFNPFPEPVAIEITDVIDLHTIHPQDVKRVVEEYLEQVHQAGFPSVRIIHGKGIGVQREIVRTVLARSSFVDSWTDAPPDAGGLGATIVRLLD